MKLFYALIITMLSLPVQAQIKSQAPIATEEDVNTKIFTGVISEQYANGSPSLWKEVTDGKASGLWLEWYPNGNLRYRSYWKNNKGHGKWEYFYENGVLRSISAYDNDVIIGLYRDYHPNGVLAREETFINGKANGISYRYDVDGTEIQSQLYKEGEKVLNKPVLFEPGKVATKNNNEWDITFTPDSQELYFTRREEGKKQQQVFVSVNENGNWSIPKPAFASADDGSTHITMDGLRMYSESFRPIPGRTRVNPYDSNIWYREKQGKAWSEPMPLGENINKVMTKSDQWPANYESGPTTDPIGNLYYWTKSSMTETSNIYMAKLKIDGSFEDPVELSEPINSEGWDVKGVFSPDGQYMIFGTSDRQGSYGGEDLYYAKKTDEGWSVPKNLGPEINSGRYEGAPRFSPDGKYFFFSSDRGTDRDADGERIWSIYYMESEYLLID